MNAGEALSKQYGPLPAGGWLLALGGGLAVAVVVRRRASSSTPNAAQLDAENLPGENTYTQPGAGNLATGPAGSDGATSGAGGATSPAPEPGTNESWRYVVHRQLVTEHYSPLLVDSALSHYLNGEPLSPAEQVVIGRALMIAGPPPISPPAPIPGTVPPDYHPTPVPPKPGGGWILPKPPGGWFLPPIPGGVTPPPPAPAPPIGKVTPPPVVRRYTIRKGDTLAKVAKALKVSTTVAWNKNHSVLDHAARKHGRKNSAHGRYLYAGTVVHS